MESCSSAVVFFCSAVYDLAQLVSGLSVPSAALLAGVSAQRAAHTKHEACNC